MHPLITDSQFNSLALILVAAIGIIPSVLAALWARKAKNSSEDAAKQVRTNGGMEDPNPNVNDHIKYQTKLLESIVERQDNTEHLLGNHIAHSRIMDQALSQVYLKVMPSIDVFKEDDSES